MKIKNLKTKQMYRFFLLIIYFNRYVKSFRLKKVKANKKHIVK